MSAPLGWSLDAIRALSASGVRLALFFRLASDPVVRVWAGAGDFAFDGDGQLQAESGDDILTEAGVSIAIDGGDVGGIDPGGATYLGVGDFISVPTLQQLVNGVAERVVFTLSGVPAASLALAREEAGVVNGAQVMLGFCLLGSDWHPITPLAWLWEGVADTVTPSSADAGDGSRTRTIALSVGSLFTGRKRPPLGFWTDAQQRRRSPDDAYCSNVSGYTQGTTKRFKPRS